MHARLTSRHSRIALLAAVLALAPGAAARAFDFHAAIHHDAGRTPEDLVVADFNDDGVLDIAVGNSDASSSIPGPDSVSVYIGLGDGRFAGQAVFGAGVRPEGLTTGLFNADAIPDLATADYGGGTVTILLGNGAGAFSAGGAVNVAGGPRGITSGDFSGDGKCDLATANFDNHTVTILLGAGNGTFTVGQSLAVGQNPEVIAAGRLNGDTRLDLATANNAGNNVSVLFSNGNGTFTFFRNIGVGTRPRHVKAIDLNGDGFDDLVTANNVANSISVLSNNAGSGFTAMTPLASVGTGPVYVNLGDLNGDGKLDCAVSYDGTNNLGLFPGLGNFAFGAAQLMNTGRTPLGIGIGDLDGEGKLDLVVANANEDNISIYLARPATPVTVLDNGQSGTSSTGTWNISSAPRPFGGSSLYSNNAGASYTFQVNLPQPGLHEVALWWTTTSNRRTDVPVDIIHTGGTSTVRVNQRQNGGQWNSLGRWTFGATATVRIRSPGSGQTAADAVCLAPANRRPVAVIDGVAPNPAGLGTPVSFGGHGTDPDGSITAHNWRSSIDGQLSTLASFSSSTLAAGTHTIFFKVRDNLGAWSAEAETTLIVSSSSNQPPAAVIDSIAPNPATQGTPVGFSGHGTDADGTITAYNWRSSIDGQLSTLASFYSNALAAGTHTIFFKVRDNLGAWSPEAQRSLQVNPPSGPVEVILDNGQPGTSSAGTWKPSGSANWFGTDSLYADDAGESYTFQLNLPQAGTYDVYAWWTRSSSRRPDVPVDIVHAGGTATVVVNQQVNGGVWNRLGSWSFGTGPTGLVATVTIRSLGGAASPNTTCADAVRLVSAGGLNEPPAAVIDSITPNPATQGTPVSFSGHGTDADGTIAAYNWRSSIDGQLSTLASFSSSALAAGAHTIFFKVRDNLGAWSPEAQRSLQVNSPSGPVEVILDNGQPGTSSAGVWKPSGSANWFGTDSLYADDAGESYTFQLNLPQTGTYDVYAWWTRSSSRRPDVPVDIVHAGGTATVVVNQQVNGGVWNRLGSWSFGTGPTGLVATITIRSLGGAASPNTTCADAVRLVRTAP